ncbi:MAG: RluA family pseudouridine synthase [Candidatus Omnitrophota bacterium]
MDIPVVYEDNYLLVVDKPSGLLTVPTPKKEKRTLTSILGFYPCHRLDRGTSGLIIYAKCREVQRRMAEAFKHRQVKKTYIAFVYGFPYKESGVIEKRIENLFAKTSYRVVEKRRFFTVVEAEPFTGRTNQLRIHFKSLGNPILGEDRFAFRKDFKIKAKRLMLHAKSLEFLHPISGKALKIEVGLPQDMLNFLKDHA